MLTLLTTPYTDTELQSHGLKIPNALAAWNSAQTNLPYFSAMQCMPWQMADSDFPCWDGKW